MSRGFSLIELLIAMAIATMTMAGVVIFIGGDQTMGTDAVVHVEALHKAQDLIEKAAAQARVDYSSVATSSAVECVSGICYTKSVSLPASYATQCTQTVVGTVSWTGEQNRALSIAATTSIANIAEMLALGGACDSAPPTKNWNPPITFASSNFNPGKPTGLDVLDKIVYMSADKAPFLYIADTTTAVLGQSSGLFISTGAFNAGAQLNDIRVAKYGASVYAFAAKDAATNQLMVIDVTNRNSPTIAATASLAGVSGSEPEAFRVYYFDKRVYVITKRTAGPEFHVFDVSNPVAPVELGTGYELNRTVESLVITRKTVAGVSRLYAYMAADLDSRELTVLDVTTPSAITEIAYAAQDLPGNQDGSSLYVIADRLYFGRLSTLSGPELYVFNVASPSTGIGILGSREIGADVRGVAVSGRLAFLATSQANNEFKVYASDPATLTPVNTNFNFPNLIENGVRYSNDFVYVASAGNDALRILYSN